MNVTPASMLDEIPAACIIDPDGRIIETVYSSNKYPIKNYKINWEKLKNNESDYIIFEGDK